MEKITAILIDKEDEINAKEDEIVEWINSNLDNFTSAAGTNRGRTERYKAMAKKISQEAQNIKAGKEADDALRDILKAADQDTIETIEYSAEDTSTIIEINAGNVANVDRVRDAVQQFANELGVEVTGNTVEFSVDEGSQIDQMVKKNGVTETEAFFVKYFEGDYPITVSIIPPAGAEEKERVQATADAFKAKPEGIKGRENNASVLAAANRFLKNRGLDVDDAEDAEYERKRGEAIASAMGKEGGEDQEDHIPDDELNIYAAQSRKDRQEELDSVWDLVAKRSASDTRSREDRVEDLNVKMIDLLNKIKYYKEQGDHAKVSSLTNKYFFLRSKMTHLSGEDEGPVIESYTSQYLTEQKHKDRLPKTKQESISFKDKMKPKTIWQLEEVRRYGL
jgi:hypothetical protein